MKRSKKKFKRKIKDTVFTALFKIPKYKLLLYKALNPKEKDITEKDIKTITLQTILSSGLYNDLGILVKDKIIFLLEAQSTWSINILARMLMYLSNTYKKFTEENNCNLYGTKKINLPKPELYVLYLGKDKISKKEYSLNEEYFENKAPIDLRVKIITVRSKQDILKEYIEFAHRSDKLRKSKKELKEKDIIAFINSCIKDNILREFLKEHREEVMSIETMLFDQDYVTEMYEHELREEGKAEGREEGIYSTLVGLVKKGLLSVKEAAKELGVTEKKFKSLMEV